MSGFWNIYVIVLVVLQVVGALWLLLSFTRSPRKAATEDTTGHTWDGDLKEYNNPLPRWWLIVFWLTAVWLVVYLIIYPGFGSFAGLTGWTEAKQYEQEVAAAEKRYGNIYAKFSGMSLAEMAKDPDAVRLGRNLFLNNCTNCHGSDARGAKGFPNLTDNAWLHGGSPEQIQQTITNGRTGVMPALGAALGEQGVDNVIDYILSLSGRGNGTPESIEAGKQKFLQMCSACHGADAKGQVIIGAPNLTDADWLHGSTEADIRDVIMHGRTNQMPAQKDLLSEDRIRTLVAYVLSLSGS